MVMLRQSNINPQRSQLASVYDHGPFESPTWPGPGENDVQDPPRKGQPGGCAGAGVVGNMFGVGKETYMCDTIYNVYIYIFIHINYMIICNTNP